MNHHQELSHQHGNSPLGTSPHHQHPHILFDIDGGAAHVEATYRRASPENPQAITVTQTPPDVHRATPAGAPRPTPPKPDVKVLNELNLPESQSEYLIKHPEALEKLVREHLRKAPQSQETQNIEVKTKANVEFECEDNGKCKVNKLAFTNNMKLHKEDHEALMQQLNGTPPDSTRPGRWTIVFLCVLSVSVAVVEAFRFHALRELFFPSFRPKPLSDEVF